MIRLYLLLLAALFPTLICDCINPVSGGGGSQTVNTFTAHVEETVIAGKGIPGHSVQCYDTGFDSYWDSSFKSTTINENGLYTLHVDSPGLYNLFSFPANTSAGAPSAVIKDLRIAPDSVLNYSKTYAPPGTIKFMPAPDSTWIQRYGIHKFVLQLPGTPFYEVYNTRTQFPVLIRNIPESEYIVKSKTVDLYTTFPPTVIIQPANAASEQMIAITNKKETVLQLIFIKPVF